MTLLLLAVAIAAAIQPAPAATDGAQGTDVNAAAIVADCEARKFETQVEIEQDGQKRLTKMKLCAVKGADQASWLRTLQDAKVKIAAHPDISAESKAKIAAELDVEIAKLQSGEPEPQQAVPTPLPPTAVAPPPPVAKSFPAAAPAKPRLTVKCLDFGQAGAGSRCMVLERRTRLSIRADENLPGGFTLRFLRRGEARGEVALAAMRQGQSVQIRLPDRLCVGVSSSKVEIQLLGSGQLVETFGPYNLRC